MCMYAHHQCKLLSKHCTSLPEVQSFQIALLTPAGWHISLNALHESIAMQAECSAGGQKKGLEEGWEAIWGSLGVPGGGGEADER